MSGTKIGGRKAARTNKRLYGEDFYKWVGRKGGYNGTTGGFAANPALARVAGRKGGRLSRRMSSMDINEKIDLYRNYIYRKYDNGSTIDEIADMVGLSHYKVQQLLYRRRCPDA